MANENIAVLGCQLKPSVNPIGSNWIPSKVIAIPANIAINVKCDGKPSIIKQLPFIAVGCTATGGYVLSSGGGVIDNQSLSSTNIKITGEKPVRKNDKKTSACSGILIKTSTPYDSIKCSCNVEVDNSGQSNDLLSVGNVTST